MVRSTRLREAAFRLVSVLVGTLIPLIALEAALRLAGWPRAPVIGWQWRGSPVKANEFGFRGHRSTGPTSATVLLLGDSTVEVGRFDEMAEVHLATALRQLTKDEIRVVSVAAAGWGQDQELLALKRYLPKIEPRVVALWFTPSNDLWNNTFPTHNPKRGWPRPTFWLEHNELRGPNAAWLESQDRERFYVMRLVDRARGLAPYVTDEEWESRLPPAYQASCLDAPDCQTAPSLREVVARQQNVDPNDVLYFGGENFASEKTHFSIALCPRSPRLEYAANLARALLAEIAKVCKEHGAELVVFYHDRAFPEIADTPAQFKVPGGCVTLSGASARTFIDEVLRPSPALMIRGVPEGATISRRDGHLNGARDGRAGALAGDSRRRRLAHAARLNGRFPARV